MNAKARSLAVPILVGVALLAALWFLAIAPKRSERSAVKDTVAAQQSRLDAAQTQVARYADARKQFPGMLSELRRLDKAVPARAKVAAMLRGLQRRAKVRDSDLRIVALKDAAQSATPGDAATTPGAVVGPGGLSALPFTFEYTGRYFDLLDILKTVRRSVRVTGGDLNIDGRLLTIDGLSFKPVDGDLRLTRALMNATAYIAPDGAAAPQPPAAAPATAVTPDPNGGS
ncbi:MAG TPA: hypothetical protein VNT54_16740 [Solirubrobacteraceae bacterium]|nr:hypothetical protein [Solirubrobacteraceae bacterium]